MLLDEDLLRGLLERLLRNGGDFADVYAQRSLFSRVSREGRRTSVSLGETAGVGLRLVKGGVPFFASVSGFEPGALLSEAEGLAACSGAGGCPAPPLPGRAGVPRRSPAGPAPAETAGGKSALLLSAEEAAFAQDPRVVSFSAICRETSGEVLVANSEGRRASTSRAHVTLYLEATAASTAKSRRGARVLSGEGSSAPSETQATLDAAREAAGAAVRRLDASAVPSGVFPTVLGPRAAGYVIHESVGHAFESDNLLEGRSPFVGKTGAMVAPRTFTLHEDGPPPGRRGAAAWDDEGTPVRRTGLIEEGRLAGFLTDRLGAERLGVPPSGHGRRESYRHPPLPRMRHLILSRGSESLRDLVGTIGFGLLVLQVGGGSVELPGGEFAFRIAEGYLIREGEVAEPIAEAVMVGDGLSLLASVDGIGSDPCEAWGTCVKGGQNVPVRDTAPSIRVPRLEIRGR